MSDPVGHPFSEETVHPHLTTRRYKDPPLDPITGFLDRKATLQAAAVLMADAGARHTRLCAIWLDIDRFRQVSESFGHPAGDGVIARIAERIRSVVGLASLMSRLPAASRHLVAISQTAERLVQQLTGGSRTQGWRKLGNSCLRLLKLVEADLRELREGAKKVLRTVD